ncbi:MAG: MarR family transcriptional regulator [Lachnospiraceae bacterium]|nr:MarR family transcriptional regulator [Lachnospiraceae bacterium]
MREQLIVALLSAQMAHQKSCWGEFRKLDLSPGQPKVLSRLRYQEGYLQKELAALCYVEPATMVVLLSNMEKKGLIRKEVDHVSGGKRAFRIYLTEEGKAMAEKVDEAVNLIEKKAFAGFSEEEKSQMIALLGRLTDNLN